MPVKRYRKNEWISAVLYGSLTGFVGVALFILVLQLANKAPDEESIPVQQQQNQEQDQEQDEVGEQTEVEFFASQHGLFSSLDAATQFINTDPTLNKAAIVEVDGQFYVWSSLAVEKQLPVSQSTSFFKPLIVGAACSNSALQNLPLRLQDEKYLKNYFELEHKEGDVPSDWASLLQATTTLSKDVNVIRLHLLAHYYSENDCLKIKF
ncbi:hypothetical protein [Solibacillus sp. CAU 1738]|uniref:hypothetical protein n=1 Tax=Solibacillus sp. CAU 1738 TaxID=3140363 RepID=UPI003261CA73